MNIIENPTLNDAAALLQRLGRTPERYIASGMEGHVFFIGDDEVAKIWFAKEREELDHLRTFYDILRNLDLPFATPQITGVEEIDGIIVSFEKFLSGTPMNEFLTGQEATPPPFAVDATLDVLAAMRDHPVPAGIINPLPVLDHRSPASAQSGGSIAMLLEVLDGRIARFGDQLRRAVPDFDGLHDRLSRYLTQLPQKGHHAVHGDLCPQNILLDADLTVSAVIDWGFLSHIGEHAFDVSIACGVLDMYGPHHRAIDDALVATCEQRLGSDRRELLIWRALYAMLTSNVYDESGADGHFAWCAEMLNREDVRVALLD